MAKVLEHRVFRCGASSFYGDEIGAVNQTHSGARLKAIAAAGQ